MHKWLARRRYTNVRCWEVFAALLLLALSGQPARAQVLFGSLVGNVSDPSGASVPGAAVKLTNVTTNDTLSLQTNDSGVYTIADLTAGTYRVEISKQGFRTFV